MKRLFLLFLLSIYTQYGVSAQIITTIAGNGTSGYGGDGGPATDAELFPAALAFDVTGNLYIADANAIRKVNTSEIITTICGNGTSGDSGDGGPATDALIDHPQGIVVDPSGNIYFTEVFKYRIRKISTTGIITTFAGNGTTSAGPNGDGGPASDAILGGPTGITIDKLGNIYFGDGGSRVRKISIDGIITTVAGNGNYGFSGDGGPATSAMIDDPWGIAVDNEGNLYIADETNNRIRKVSNSGVISTYAGNGFYAYMGDGGSATAAELGPRDLVVDNFGNLFFSDFSSNTIRQINSRGYIYTIAGNGVTGYAGDGNMATSAEFSDPWGVLVDNCDNVYIADGGNNRVRKVTFPHCDYLGVKSVNEYIGIKIYPNPTNGILNIDNIRNQASYRILNIIGQPVKTGSLKEETNNIDVYDLANGIYLLEIIDDVGEATLKKLIKSE